MMIRKITLFMILITTSIASGQVRSTGDVWVAKEFSKDVALYDAKNFLFKTVIGSSPEVVEFEVIPLAAASSGELTTLLYKCDSKSKEGLVLGFFGNYWNQSGVVYQGFAFKNFEKDKATEFLNKIQSSIDSHSKFLKDEKDNNNIFFTYDDVDVLIWSSADGYTIRLFWNGFDSSWEKTAFERSKRRFEKKIK